MSQGQPSLYSDGYAVTASDSADLPRSADAIYVGGAGAIKLVTEGGHVTTFAAVPVGTILPVRTTRIYSTDTTATNLVALNWQADYGGSEVLPSASIESEIVDRAGAFVLDRRGNEILAGR